MSEEKSMQSGPRYDSVSRRALLQGFPAAALLGGMGVLSACSSSDSAALASGSTAASAAGDAAMTVDFTFEQTSSNGPSKNPYIAVWLEDASEKLVAVLSVWHIVDRDDRWFADLKRYAQVAGSVETNSGPTRTPGTYSVTWNGLGADGAKVAAGSYFICIEAAREHGPYELIREEIAVGKGATTKKLTPSNELTAASVTVKA